MSVTIVIESCNNLFEDELYYFKREVMETERAGPTRSRSARQQREKTENQSLLASEAEEKVASRSLAYRVIVRTPCFNFLNFNRYVG